jgi:glycosyltransferase involved in cell wall biosynthesis
LVIASDTAPVREVIRDGVNGRLVPFNDPGLLAERVGEALVHPTLSSPAKRTALTTAASYSRALGLLGYDQIVNPVPKTTPDFNTHGAKESTWAA